MWYRDVEMTFDETGTQLRAVNSQQDLTNKAVKLFNSGLSAGAGAQQLYRSSINPPSLQDLTTAVAAVWADSFGAGTQQRDTNALAQVIYSAAEGAFRKDDCTTVAVSTMNAWLGFLARKALNDTGAVPYPDVNNVTSSPDIIANGRSMASDQDLAAWVNNYGTMYWVQPTSGNNYVYVRTKDLFPSNQRGSAKLYQYVGSVTAPPPSQWTAVSTLRGDDSTPLVAASTGQVLLGQDPFLFNFNTPKGEHICLAALISTPYVSNEKPDDGNFNLAQWLVYSPSSCWHNVGTAQAKSLLAICNHDATAEAFRYEAAGVNLPKGTRVRLSAPDGVQAKSNQVEGVADGALLEVQSAITLPARYAGKLEVSIEVPGGRPLPAGAYVDLRSYWIVAKSNKDHANAAPIARSGANGKRGDEVQVLMGAFTLVGRG